jgi:hypothetical protein
MLDQVNRSARKEPPRPLLDGPSAWIGADLHANPGTWAYTLSPGEAEFIARGRECTHRLSRPDADFPAAGEGWRPFGQPSLCSGIRTDIDEEKEPCDMPPTLTDDALDYLLEAAGLSLTGAQKADLKTVHDALAAMKMRVRQPRGRMAELAHTYGFTEADLA